MRLGLLILIAAASARAQQKRVEPVTCPAVISDKLSIQRRFERPSILNIDRRGREYDLAPDGGHKAGNLVAQTWDLDAYREMRVFLRCRYRDTDSIFAIELPATVRVCTFRYKAAANGGVTGAPEFSCR